MKCRCVSLLLISLLLSACASPPDSAFKLGRLQLHERHYAAAYNNFAFASSYNIPEAQYAVGYMYYYGYGVKQNQSLGIRWISRAAANGDPRAQSALNYYRDNEPLPPSLQF